MPEDPGEAPVRPRMGAVLAEGSVGGDAARVAVHGDPPRLHRLLDVRLAHREIDRPGAAVVGDHDVEQGLDRVGVARAGDL